MAVTNNSGCLRCSVVAGGGAAGGRIPSGLVTLSHSLRARLAHCYCLDAGLGLAAEVLVGGVSAFVKLECPDFRV